MIDSLLPVSFGTATGHALEYLRQPAIQRVVEFFEGKGVAALKLEDQQERWYGDWINFQTTHHLYAGVLSPQKYSTLGNKFDLLKAARFWEALAYYSPSHGYSLHVSFLGIFPILMSANEELKKEAVATLERGGLFAFAVSEKEHGSDLMSNEFTLRHDGSAGLVANGSKYYIGNANVASIISVMARNGDSRSDGRSSRAAFTFFALRPSSSQGVNNLRKIRTLGIRSAYVGEFQVTDQRLAQGDVLSEGRRAWDSMFGTVTIGKFLLGFGSIGICEHALIEADQHVRGRVLYGKPVMEMSHIRSAMTHAFARLTAMKLYAYRALDYLQVATEEDRRYLLFCAVQKAKVSTEGVRVMAQLFECVGAKGLESDTYFEGALRDIQLFPSLEGSTHVNYSLTTQFLSAYFFNPDVNAPSPALLGAGASAVQENAYLFHADNRTTGVRFDDCLKAYGPLMSIANVKLFARQVKALKLFALAGRSKLGLTKGADAVIALGRCLSTIVYAQLVAETAVIAELPRPLIAVIFHQLIESLSAESIQLAAFTRPNSLQSLLLGRVHTRPRSIAADIQAASEWITARGTN